MEENLSIYGLALEVALWSRYCAGIDDENNPFEVADENAPRLKDHAMKAKSAPAAFLSIIDIYSDLGTHLQFSSAFAAALGSLWSHGTATTLTLYINGELFDDNMLR